MKTNNNVITAITLIEHVKPLLHYRDRAPIQIRHLVQIQQRLVTALELISNDIKTPLVTVPLGEVITLIDVLQNERNFVETSAEIKETICSHIFSALDQLYFAAGKFYEKNEFDYSVGLEPVLQGIVNVNIENGYYFGLEGEV